MADQQEPAGSPDDERRRTRRAHTVWWVVGGVLAGVLALAGLAVVGVGVFVVVAMNSWGSNK